MLRIVIEGAALLALGCGVLLQAARISLAWRRGNWSFRGALIRRTERPAPYWAITAINATLLAIPLMGFVIFIRAISN